MRAKSWGAGVLCLVIAAAGVLRVHAELPAPAVQSPRAVQDGISVYFSPRGGCTDAIVAELGSAKKTIKIQAYSFTSVRIAKAILNAKKRGVNITVILDKSQQTEKYSSATFLNNSEVPVFIDAIHAIAHNKLMLIDGTTIITGSFNFTAAAEASNAENLLVIHDKAVLYAAYDQNFQEHLGHSIKYTGPDGASATVEKGDSELVYDLRPPSAAAASVETPPQPTAQPAPAADADDPIVYVTKTGHDYHSQGCSYLRRSSIPMKKYLRRKRGDTNPALVATLRNKALARDHANNMIRCHLALADIARRS